MDTYSDGNVAGIAQSDSECYSAQDGVTRLCIDVVPKSSDTSYMYDYTEGQHSCFTAPATASPTSALAPAQPREEK